MPSHPVEAQRKHILSIAFEDYFHGPAFAHVVSRQRWNRFETRLEQNCEWLLAKLDTASCRATFFVDSWAARNSPTVLREVVRRGHEIALAGARGRSFRVFTPDALRTQLRRDRDLLEEVCQRRVVGFRVTDVLLRPMDLWALDVLASEGFQYDLSLSPFLRTFAAEPWRQFVHRNVLPSGELWEVPLASSKLAGLMIPIAGGNYFRQFPESWTRFTLARWERQCKHPLVLYFRLWDFDPAHPKLQTGSIWRDFRHYRNGGRMVRMLEQLLSQFQFTSISDFLQLESDELPALAPAKSVAKVPAFHSMAANATKISVIVPCFNEEAGIPYLKRSLDELTEQLSPVYKTQFILVDDGSSDGTWRVLNQYFFDRSDTLLLRHPKNRGVSAAILTGLEHAHEIACSIDCDCSYDPGELKPMLERMRDGVDLVTASPYHPDGSVLNVPAWRLTLSRCSSCLYRLVTGKKLYTFTACMRIYRRSSVLSQPVTNPGFLGIAELLSRLLLDGKQVVEHPATLEVRLFGQSSMKIARTIGGHLRLLTKLARIRLQGRVPALRHRKAADWRHNGVRNNLGG